MHNEKIPMRHPVRRRHKRKLNIRGLLIIFTVIIIAVAAIIFLRSSSSGGAFTAAPVATPLPPDELLLQYFAHIEYGRFNDMYDMLTTLSQEAISRADFVDRNSRIYEAIGARNITVIINDVSIVPDRPGRKFVNYSLSMGSVAGKISHDRQAIFELDADNIYRLQWSSHMIFPELGPDDRVRVGNLPAQRGNIYDRNGIMLAGPGPASQVGLVPGRMRRQEADDTWVNSLTTPNSLDISTFIYDEEDIALLAALLEMTPERILQRLSASYVREDTFVLLRTIARDAQELIDDLLTVQGVLINSTTVRYYPLGRSAAHLIGYIQNINAEELEELRHEGYHMNSVIGRAGLERILEDQLRARDGREIFIVDSQGSRITTVARLPPMDGRSVDLHICMHIQNHLYEQFAGDRSTSVAMNPITGEVLALVSTPSYDPNDFVRGMTSRVWEGLMEDENLPMFNRFRATFSPGSTMKAITAAIGIDAGAFTYDQDFGPSGRRWQQDESWGRFFVTTVTQYNGPANLNNAMAWSDNIYFAKATLQIGSETFVTGLENFGFGEAVPFEYGLFSSTISRTGAITTDILLADSGYGQGEILMNPVHLAAVYSTFVNAGSMIRPQLISPRLVYDVFFEPEFWRENIVSPETARIVLDSLIFSVDYGTGRPARSPERIFAGKTGTAELKLSQDDEDGIELGWFVLMTADEGEAHPLLVVSMVEGVENRGGSGYVIPKIVSTFNFAELRRRSPIYFGFGQWSD